MLNMLKIALECMHRCQTYAGTLWKRIADDEMKNQFKMMLDQLNFTLINPNIIISAINLLKQTVGN